MDDQYVSISDPNGWVAINKEWIDGERLDVFIIVRLMIDKAIIYRRFQWKEGTMSRDRA